MAQLIEDLDARTVADNLARVREQIDRAATAAGRDPADVQLLAATKYVPCAEMAKLAVAGVTLVGENRAQDLDAKASRYGELFTWDFIGALQSRKVRSILPHVRMIHSVASESALQQIERHRDLARPDFSILIEVNVAGEPGKAGVAPEELDGLIESSPVAVSGLMGMVPLTTDPRESRSWFAQLRRLAEQRGLSELSMGTSQDFVVAVQEGATIVRIGTILYR